MSQEQLTAVEERKERYDSIEATMQQKQSTEEVVAIPYQRQEEICRNGRGQQVQDNEVEEKVVVAEGEPDEETLPSVDSLVEIF